MKRLIKTLAAAGAMLLGVAAAQADEGPAYTDPLPENPVEITRAFFADHTAWNDYAHAHYDETKDFSGPQTAYRRLIDLYCGPEKRHQGLAFGSEPDFDAERSEITGTSEEGGTYTVIVRHTGPFDFIAEYEFEFERKGEAWRLVEVYYLDDYGGERLPRL